MIQLERSVLIERLIENVFLFVADFENEPIWERNFANLRQLLES